MAIKWKTKRFEALSVNEMYSVLKLRSEVFVVEQNCVYQDLDGKDSKALHLFGDLNGEIVAYCRLFDACRGESYFRCKRFKFTNEVSERFFS